MTTSAIPFIPAGTSWGTVPSAAELPNVSGAAFQAINVAVYDTCYSIADDTLYVCTSPTAGAATWSALATVSGSGIVTSAQRVIVGTWGVTLAASQTDNGLDIGGITDGAVRVIRAGKLTGFSTVASAAPTDANVTVSVFKNGVVTALSVTYTAGVTTSASDTDAGITVAAGDLVTVKYTSLAISNTPVMSAQVEITYD